MTQSIELRGARENNVHDDVHLARSKGTVIGFWIATVLFCLQIGFTAYAQELGLGRGHRRALGHLVLLLAAPAGRPGERLIT